MDQGLICSTEDNVLEVGKKELSQKKKLRIHWFIYTPTIIYGHEVMRVS